MSVGDGEEVHRSNGLAMVSEERQPSFHRIWICWGSPDPSRDTPFRDIETELEQFAVNTRCSSGRILGNHREDQGANLSANPLPSSYMSDSGDPYPIQTKPRPMPVHDGPGSDQDERLPPPGPERSQRNPKQLVQGSQPTARLLRVQSQQLPTESHVFKDEVLPGTESADHPPEDVPERGDHGKNLVETIRIQLFAKSFILQVYDVLDSSSCGKLREKLRRIEREQYSLLENARSIIRRCCHSSPADDPPISLVQREPIPWMVPATPQPWRKTMVHAPPDG